MTEPPIRIVGAAPLTPFAGPLRAAARSGLWVLLIVSGTVLLLGLILVNRISRAFREMARASEEVASGALDRRLDEKGIDEMQRVARAFNKMTGSLRDMLQSLSEQRALARVGEFAASLAHEVRNPLTAIRVDLQVAEETLAKGDSQALRPLRRALAEIKRLDNIVGSALLTTRAARPDRRPVSLMKPLQAAIEAAEKSAERPLAISLQRPEEQDLLVSGDEAALEQLFLNLLLNAVEAVRESGEIEVTVERRADQIAVRIADSGVGLTPLVARHAFEPLFTTRERGSGLGLTIAERIARALDGTVDLAAAERGAVATVVLPAVTEPD